MTDQDAQTRIEALETRLTHQEAAIDELTQSLLRQENRIREHTETLQRLELQVRALTPPDGEPAADEKPPHY